MSKENQHLNSSSLGSSKASSVASESCSSYEEVSQSGPSTVYQEDTFISTFKLSPKSTVPSNILEFDYSYGYDCRKYYNLVQLDERTLVFASGNLITFLDLETSILTFRRTALGGGVGHIRKNPTYATFAIAENGSVPLIIIYEWPKIEINCVLRGGTEKSYNLLDYNPDGSLLVSQGGDPDYNITIWDWPNKTILLKTKSYVNEVFRVKFSPYVPCQLTTCGLAHIKFWKMASTFTGLKLQGEIGRFGKTEFSDILGVLAMPDEKVVSGSSWGNMLIWDGGLIRLEVFRTLKRKCHDAPIVEIYYEDGELWTIGMDGHIKVWWYEKIDQADPPDDDRTIQIEPTYDFEYPGIMLMSIKSMYVQRNGNYYAQDGNGGIWQMEINTEEGVKEPVQVFKCHAGKVLDLVVCPWGPYLVSLGEEGKMMVYDYTERKLIFDHQFPARGGSIIWLPIEVSQFGDEIIAGFDDGSLRVMIITIEYGEVTLTITQVIKPHLKLITRITINPTNTVLVSGSEDATIFIFQITKSKNDTINLVPIGYVPVPDAVTYFTWNCQNDYKVIVGCSHGQISQVTVPEVPQDYTTITYKLKLEIVEHKFTSYKSQIRRDEKIREIEEKKAAKIERKMKDLERIKSENPGMIIDEEIFLADSDDEEKLEPLYFPPVPNRIIYIESMDENTIWLSVGGYDSGFIYEYLLDGDNATPNDFFEIEDVGEQEICCFVYNKDKKFKIFGTDNGFVRVNQFNPENPGHFPDYWVLPMHENSKGFISKIIFSYDEDYLFTCGYDGNIYSFRFNYEGKEPVEELNLPMRMSYPQTIIDENKCDILSLEQTIVKAEEDRILKVANERKKVLREQIHELGEKYYELLQRNEKLIPSQKIHKDEMELDPRVTEYINDTLESRLNLVKRKLEFDVEKSRIRMNKLLKHFIEPLDYFPITLKGIVSSVEVSILRTRKLDSQFDEMMKTAEAKILEDQLKGRPVERAQPAPKAVIQKKEKESRLEYFLLNLSPEVIEYRLGTKLSKFLMKYRARKSKWEKRDEEWEEFLAKKPAKGATNPEDEAALTLAENTIGNFLLKTSDDYKVPISERETTVKKYKELLECRKMEFDLRHNFNKKLMDLRDYKVTLKDELSKLEKLLKEVHSEIPNNLRKYAPKFTNMLHDSEFAESRLEIKVKLEMEEEEAEEMVQLVVEPNQDKLEKELLGGKNICEGNTKLICGLSFDELLKIAPNDEDKSPWEKEIEETRRRKKIYQQEQIIKEIKNKVKSFDDNLEKLVEERLDVDVRSSFMQIFILTLHQELMILSEYEFLENSLHDEVNKRTTEILDIQDVIDELNEKIYQIEKENEDIKGQEKNIEDSFLRSIVNNKFFDFLKRVFRKKVKPPKVNEDSESSSESSDSSSMDEDDDEGSIDSRDYNIVRLDLNVCPKGCDESLYELTCSFRMQKYECGEKIKENLKSIESLNKEIDSQTRKRKAANDKLNVNMTKLEEYQREKQKKINEVRCTVLLKYNQICNFENNEINKIEDSLVFLKKNLCKLYHRVDELHSENEIQLVKHRKSVKHMMRMKTDIKFMQGKIIELERKICEETKNKFGKVVDIITVEEGLMKRTFGKDNLIEMEEAVLKKLVHDLRLSLINIKSIYEDEINLWQKRTEKYKKILRDQLEINTSKVEIFTLLTKEKNELETILQNQDKKLVFLEKVEKFAKNLEKELAKLQLVINDQNNQMKQLNDEIKMLKIKGIPPKKFTRKIIGEKDDQEDIDLQKYASERELLTITDSEFEVIDHPEVTPVESETKESTSTEAESKQMAEDLIKEMLEYLNLYLPKISEENFIKEILDNILTRSSVEDIVKELITQLPLDSDEKKMEIIETTAEQLYILNPENKEEVGGFISSVINRSVEFVNQKIADEIMQKVEDNLPDDLEEKQKSLEKIVSHIATMSKEDLENLAKHSSEEIQRIIDDDNQPKISDDE